MAPRMMAAGAMNAHREVTSISLFFKGVRARRTSPAVIVLIAMFLPPECRL